jgi:chromosome segregation ATPase
MRTARLLMLAAGLVAAPVAATPLEDRLRDQLRSTVVKLRALQAAQAGLEAAKTAAERERDAAKAQPRHAGPDAATTRALAAARSAGSSAAARAAAAETELATTSSQLTEAGERLRAVNAELAQARAAATAGTARATAVETALTEANTRNARLVTTGHELVALHEKRYGHRRYLPLQLARRRIETEAQAMGDRVAADVQPPAVPVQ